jgi:hypothetical protein
MFIALNAGHYLRNYAVWGNPLVIDNDMLMNDNINMKVMIAECLIEYMDSI